MLKLYKNKFHNLYFLGNLKEKQGTFIYGIMPFSFISKGKPTNIRLYTKNYKEVTLKMCSKECITWIPNLEYIWLKYQENENYKS